MNKFSNLKNLYINIKLKSNGLKDASGKQLYYRNTLSLCSRTHRGNFTLCVAVMMTRSLYGDIEIARKYRFPCGRFWNVARVHAAALTFRLRAFAFQSHEPAKLIFVSSNLLILACIPCRIAGDRHAEDAILVYAVPGSWFLLMFFAG